MSDPEILIYGTNWCSDCLRTQRFFRQHKIEFKWIDVDRYPEAEQFVLNVNQGLRSVPTIVFQDGSILVEPSDRQLSEKLKL